MDDDGQPVSNMTWPATSSVSGTLQRTRIHDGMTCLKEQTTWSPYNRSAYAGIVADGIPYFSVFTRRDLKRATPRAGLGVSSSLQARATTAILKSRTTAYIT